MHSVCALLGRRGHETRRDERALDHRRCIGPTMPDAHRYRWHARDATSHVLLKDLAPDMSPSAQLEYVVVP